MKASLNNYPKKSDKAQRDPVVSGKGKNGRTVCRNKNERVYLQIPVDNSVCAVWDRNDRFWIIMYPAMVCLSESNDRLL